MDVISSPLAFREACDVPRAGGRTVGFVPTMGALHQGHARLVREALRECEFVACSIFVNPLQFAPGEDLASYPRRLEGDKGLLASLGVDVLFAPAEEALYAGGRPDVSIDAGPLGDRLEGASRPGHFRGVLTVVAKLLHLTGPCRAYFGEKDAQQLALVRRMILDLDFPVVVVPVETVRDPDGLALSSRNAYLSPEDRRAAPVLFEALADAARLVRAGERDAHVLRAEMARTIASEPRARIEYVALVDDATWEEVEVVDRPVRALVAARVGPARLIDNLLLPWADVQNSRGRPDGRQEG